VVTVEGGGVEGEEAGMDLGGMGVGGFSTNETEGGDDDDDDDDDELLFYDFFMRSNIMVSLDTAISVLLISLVQDRLQLCARLNLVDGLFGVL
jgi:hypothetical protein